jgi:nucleoside-diphosphate-sugar epimerase
METILVTGAAGFLGSHLVECLVQRGYAVRAADVPGADLAIARQAGAEAVAADLFDTDAMERALLGVDSVVHVAALFDLGAPKSLLYKVNVEAVERLCALCAASGLKRFIHVSTSAVYGRPARVPIEEDDPKRPLEPYGMTKWEGERRAFAYFEQHGLPVVVVRPTLIYGPRSRYGHALYLAAILLLKARGLRGLPMLAGGPLNHSVHVIDVCRAIERLLEDEAAIGQAFNVADAEPLTLEAYLRAIMEPFGLVVLKRVHYYPRLWRSFVRLLLWVLPLGLKRLNKRIATRWDSLAAAYRLVPALKPKADRTWLQFVLYDQCYDTSRLRALGWQPRYPDFREGIKETIQWYLSQRWLPAECLE